MRFIFLSLIVLCLSPLILNADSCTIETTKDKDISSFGDCKGFSVSSDSKTFCYVSGVDANFNEISACQELTASEKGAAVDLNEVEMENVFTRKYYLEADCNFGKKLHYVTLMIENLILPFQLIFARIMFMLVCWE